MALEVLWLCFWKVGLPVKGEGGWKVRASTLSNHQADVGKVMHTAWYGLGGGLDLGCLLSPPTPEPPLETPPLTAALKNLPGRKKEDGMSLDSTQTEWSAKR